MIQKRERSFKWCITNNNFSSTTHSLNRKSRQSGVLFFVLFWESLWVKLLQRLEKKDFENDSFVSHFFFMKSCWGNCPKYRFSFFVFVFRGTKFYGQSIIHLYRAANFFVCVFFWFFDFRKKYTIKCGVFCCCSCCK